MDCLLNFRNESVVFLLPFNSSDKQQKSGESVYEHHERILKSAIIDRSTFWMLRGPDKRQEIQTPQEGKGMQGLISNGSFENANTA